jgi:hypothetical protein
MMDRTTVAHSFALLYLRSAQFLTRIHIYRLLYEPTVSFGREIGKVRKR